MAVRVLNEKKIVKESVSIESLRVYLEYFLDSPSGDLMDQYGYYPARGQLEEYVDSVSTTEATFITTTRQMINGMTDDQVRHAFDILLSYNIGLGIDLTESKKSVKESSGGFEVAWREFDRNDRIVTKTKEFSSKKAMDRFIDRIKEKDNFYEIYGTRYPEEDTVSESAVRTVKRSSSRRLRESFNIFDGDSVTVDAQLGYDDNDPDNEYYTIEVDYPSSSTEEKITSRVMTPAELDSIQGDVELIARRIDQSGSEYEIRQYLRKLKSMLEYRTVKRLRSKKLESRVIPYIEDEDSGSRSNPKAGPWEIVPVPIGKVYNSREEAMRDPEVANSDKEVLLAEEGEELFDELLAEVEAMNNAYQESLRKNTRSDKK